MLSYNNVSSLALSAALTPPNLEEDCSPQWAAFLLAPWTIKLLFPSHLSKGHPPWLPPYYLSEPPPRFPNCPLLFFSSFHEINGECLSLRTLCYVPGNCQTAESSKVSVLQVQVLYNNAIQPVIHCVASTTAKPHSLKRHNFQGNTPRLGLMLFTAAVVSAISSSLKITEIYSES